MHACAIILGSDVRFRASQHSQGSCSLQRVCNREPLTPSKSVTVPHLSRTALPDHCGQSCVPHPLTRASRPRSRKHAVRDTRRAYGPAISLVSSVCSAMLIALIKHCICKKCTTVTFCHFLLNEQNAFLFEKSDLASQQYRLFLLPCLRPGSR